MGFPVSMFTVLFALARTVGWIAQWKEMIEDPGQQIGRPRQLYTGAPRRDYIPITERIGAVGCRRTLAMFVSAVCRRRLLFARKDKLLAPNLFALILGRVRRAVA